MCITHFAVTSNMICLHLLRFERQKELVLGSRKGRLLAGGSRGLMAVVQNSSWYPLPEDCRGGWSMGMGKSVGAVSADLVEAWMLEKPSKTDLLNQTQSSDKKLWALVSQSFSGLSTSKKPKRDDEVLGVFFFFFFSKASANGFSFANPGHLVCRSPFGRAGGRAGGGRTSSRAEHRRAGHRRMRKTGSEAARHGFFGQQRLEKIWEKRKKQWKKLLFLYIFVGF